MGDSGCFPRRVSCEVGNSQYPMRSDPQQQVLIGAHPKAMQSRLIPARSGEVLAVSRLSDPGRVHPGM